MPDIKELQALSESIFSIAMCKTRQALLDMIDLVDEIECQATKDLLSALGGPWDGE